MNHLVDDLQRDLHTRQLDWMNKIRPHIYGKDRDDKPPSRVKENHKTKITRFRNRKALFKYLGFDTTGAKETEETIWLVQEPGEGFSVSRFKPRSLGQDRGHWEYECLPPGSYYEMNLSDSTKEQPK